MLYAPAPPPAPALSISVTDGREAARSGGGLGYVVTVRNDGGAELKGLRLEQRIPSPGGGLTADQGGRVRDGVVSWTVDVPAYGERQLRAQALVGRTTTSSDAERSRLASTACAFLADAEAPAVCATDTDTLAASASAAVPGDGTATTLVGIAAAFAAAIGGALLVLRQRSRRFSPSVATSAENEDQTA